MHTKQNLKNNLGFKVRLLVSVVFIFLLISCVISFFFGTYSFGSSAVENNAVYGAAREFTSYDEQLPPEAIDFLNAPLSPEEQAIVDEKANNNSNQSNDEMIKVNVRPVVYDEKTGQYYESPSGLVELFDLTNRTVGTPISPYRQIRFLKGQKVKEFETAKDQRFILRIVIEPLPGISTTPFLAIFYFDIVDTHQDIYKDLVVTCSTPQANPTAKDELGALAFVNIPGVFFNNNISID